MRKLPLSCNLRFNAKNERHMKAAEILSMVGSRYKTAFVAIAVEAYLNAHPAGIDMNELREVQKDTWRAGKSSIMKSKVQIINTLPPDNEPAPPATPAHEPDESREAAKNALNYYNI